MVGRLSVRTLPAVWLCALLAVGAAQRGSAPTSVGEYVHARAEGSTFRMMEATGHCPHMSAPEETIALIREYLQTSTVA